MSEISPLTSYRQQKRDGMVQAILVTARTIMREQGVAALSMQELARRMNLRAPSLYHYFAGKMELYDALFRLGFRLYGEHMQQVYQGASSWQDYLERSFEGYLAFAKQNPDLYQLCFERPIPGFVPSPESLQVSLDLLHHFYDMAAEWKGAIHADLSPQQIIDLIIAMMHGITAMQLANDPDGSPEEGRFGSLIPAATEIFEKAWSRE
jgi:AcrR family transcriptional regulator